MIEEPYYDKNGTEIKEFAVLKVFHFKGVNRRGNGRKNYFMYKWVRLIEEKGKKYWYAQHLTDASGFFEKGSNKTLTGYGLRGVANAERKVMSAEIVQQYDKL